MKLVTCVLAVALCLGLANGEADSDSIRCYSCSSSDNYACGNPMSPENVETEACPGYTCATMNAYGGYSVVRTCSCPDDLDPNMSCDTCYGDLCNGNTRREEMMMSASADVTVKLSLIFATAASVWFLM